MIVDVVAVDETHREDRAGGWGYRGSNIPGVGREKGATDKNVTITLGVCRCSAHVTAVGNKVLTNFSPGDYGENC